MPTEPSIKRTVAFFDGQNLFHHAKAAFGYPFPNYDPHKLADHICATKGWQLTDVYFYTGVPSDFDKPFWNHFWTAKMPASIPMITVPGRHDDRQRIAFFDDAEREPGPRLLWDMDWKVVKKSVQGWVREVAG